MDLVIHYPDNINVVYYTHPLCCQSWEMQESWQQLLQDFHQAVRFHLCMLDVDPLQNRPLNGQGISSAKNTSLPCLAVKAVSLQSQSVAGIYLSTLRQAQMQANLNICSLDVLMDLARQVGRSNPNRLDLIRFGRDLCSRAGRQALLEDHQKARLNRIAVCPTLTFTLRGRGIKLSGEINYQQMVEVIQKLTQKPQA